MRPCVSRLPPVSFYRYCSVPCDAKSYAATRSCELNVKGQISIIGWNQIRGDTESLGIGASAVWEREKGLPGASLFRHPVETSELVCCSRGAARLGSAVIPYGDVVAIDARQLECLLCVDVFPPTHRDVSLV